MANPYRPLPSSALALNEEEGEEEDGDAFNLRSLWLLALVLAGNQLFQAAASLSSSITLSAPAPAPAPGNSSHYSNIVDGNSPLPSFSLEWASFSLVCLLLLTVFGFLSSILFTFRMKQIITSPSHGLTLFMALIFAATAQVLLNLKEIEGVKDYNLLLFLSNLPLEKVISLVIQPCSNLLALLLLGGWSTRLSPTDVDSLNLEEEESERLKKLTREHGASLFSRFLFSWMNEMIMEGNKRQLEAKDLWNLNPYDQTEDVISQYRRSAAFKLSPKYSTVFRLFYFSYDLIFWQLLGGVVVTCLQFNGPYFLYLIVSKLSQTDISYPTSLRLDVIPLFVGLFLSMLVVSVVQGQTFALGCRSGNRFRTLLMDLLYSKTLMRVQGVSETNSGSEEKKSGEESGKEGEEGSASLGKIVTLMSVDCERIRWFVFQMDDVLVSLPLNLTISILSLFIIVGWSALAAVAVSVILGILSSFLGKFLIKFEEELLGYTDARVSIVNEMLQGIRIIKYFAWEPYFTKKVGVAREKELGSMFRLGSVWLGFSILGSSTGIIIAVFTFYTHVVILGNNLDAATAFTAIKLLGQLKEVMMRLPTEVLDLVQAKVSFDRISSYLNERELDIFNEAKSPTFSDEDILDKEQSIGFNGEAEFKYYGTNVEASSNSETVSVTSSSASNPNQVNNASFNLRKLDIKFPYNRLSVICGSTGSGKTSLLLALLGEMECIKGSFHLPKSSQSGPVMDKNGYLNTVAYVPQTAWLLNATIRENILFGEEFNAERYENVLRGCALVKDLQNFDGGDLCEIGEKGINVSGISLARACYSRSSTVLFDDPLSAVDAPTAKHLLHKAILGLLKGRTILLVSHATYLVVPYADWVVSLKGGEIAFQGTAVQGVMSNEWEGLSELDLNAATKRGDLDETEVIEEPFIPLGNAVVADAGTGTTLIQDEEVAAGAVKREVYLSSMRAAGGIPFFSMVFIGFFLSVGSGWFNDWWLKNWTDKNAEDGLPTHKNFSALPISMIQNFDSGSYSMNFYSIPFAAAVSPSSNPSFFVNYLSAPPASTVKNDAVFFLAIYALIGLGYIIIGVLKDFIVLIGGFWASRKLHSDMLQSILRAPLRFFEITPIGRILNRFSKDIETVDNQTIQSLQFFLWCVFTSFSTLVFIGVLTPVFLIIVPFISIAFFYYAQLYLNVTRELKRLESISKSPIYSQFSETLAGVSSIRAYDASERFSKASHKSMDKNSEAFIYMWMANRWLSMRTDILSCVVIFVAGLAIIAGRISSGWAALLLNFSFDLTWQVRFVIRMHAQLEMNLNSVERVLEFSTLDSEEPAIIENNRPPAAWPNHGAIQVNDLSMRYAKDLPDVLKNVTFNVRPNEKVAVVGRTGAGKSTLSLAFFRIIPFSSGSITIDGIDISQIGLHDLRSKVTIIPQDPVLFSGTLRSNLDPLGENDDASIWQSLKRVNFMESMQQNQEGAEEAEEMGGGVAASETSTLLPNFSSNSTSVSNNGNNVTLDYNVSENGSNFSQGQKQLLCLARSLLQRNKILFLDEATASVDNITDQKIQVTLRKEFQDTTIICIAHRLRTVADYDKILVLDKGEVQEFGSPLELMKADGQFAHMCRESGDYEELYEMASKGFLG